MLHLRHGALALSRRGRGKLRTSLASQFTTKCTDWKISAHKFLFAAETSTASMLTQPGFSMTREVPKRLKPSDRSMSMCSANCPIFPRSCQLICIRCQFNTVFYMREGECKAKSSLLTLTEERNTTEWLRAALRSCLIFWITPDLTQVHHQVKTGPKPGLKRLFLNWERTKPQIKLDWITTN